jgi:hypothetical protein
MVLEGLVGLTRGIKSHKQDDCGENEGWNDHIVDGLSWSAS